MQNLLLILGGLLLTVAAVVFTVVSWGRMGIGGRAAVLAGFTALAMLAPVVLVRRRLTATAETMAGFAIALLLLDGYAARRVGFLGVDAIEALDYTAGVCGLVALILAAYAQVVPLRGPGPVAVVLAQPVLPLLAGNASATWLVAMLVATAALDVALVRYGRAGVRTTAALCGSAVAILALLGGGSNALGTDSAGEALGRSAPLVALVLLGAFVAWSLTRSGREEGEIWASLVTVGTVLALIAALASVTKPALSPEWRPLAVLVPALVVALAATWLPWRRVRLAGMATGGVLALLTALTSLPRLAVTLMAPLAWLDTLWMGTWDGRPGTWDGGPGTWGGAPWPGEVASPVDVVVLGALAAGFLVGAARATGEWRVWTMLTGAPVSGAPVSVTEVPASGAPVSSGVPVSGSGTPVSGVPVSGASVSSRVPVFGSGTLVSRVPVFGALVFGALMVAVAPVACAMSYPAAVAVQVVLAAALTVAAALSRTPWWAGACALVAGAALVEAAAYAFGSKPATLIALPILAVPATAVALAGRVMALRVWGLGAAVLLLALDAVAIGLAVGLQVKVAASVGFAVAGVLLLARSLWPGEVGRAEGAGPQEDLSRKEDMAGEGLGRAEGVAGVGLGPEEGGGGKEGLGLEKGLVRQEGFGLGEGVSPELLRYVGTALLLVASWLRLWAGEVTLVEAYTVPCSLVLLGFGWWRRRSSHVSSWAAYGAGLSSTMAPSLLVVYADTEWRRSLLLGVVALAVLLAGARSRLQAPTVIGGIVLAGVVVRELAPYVSEMLVAVPRWVPIAVGGLLLVVVGATYEARTRDLRRLRDTLAKMV
ncbi:SCO7613 C-terminal domain-containing membrane protein [Sphaerisporangium flaviroseum]|uniref:SCO7613 C-terminal domain-containing membrane protein n=1 Tax=Sphaerisporangium flaviroseum TaxID=509199 RepID=UPI0031ED62E9